jgi:hypothetical protein
MHATGANHTTVLTATSSGVVNLLYPVRDRLESSFDPGTFCTLRLQKHAEEGPRKRESHVVFDYTRGQSKFEEKDLNRGQIRRAQHPIPPCVTDVMSGFYYLASLPLSAGSVFRFPISDGGPVSEIEARVDGREKVKVPAGTFPSVRMAIEAVSGPLQRKGKLWVWYSDDPQHVLVQMKAKVKWGTLTFRLKQADKQ